MNPAPSLVSAVALCAAVYGCCGNDPLLAYMERVGRPHPPIPQVAEPAQVKRQADVGTWTEFKNVDFRFDEDLVLRVTRLRGIMKGHAGGPVIFDQPDSFDMELSEAETSMG